MKDFMAGNVADSDFMANGLQYKSLTFTYTSKYINIQLLDEK